MGRVGPMTRAATALAPESGRTGVVFHGMAGAGKTACALELAYTHQDTFPLLVWHAGPDRGPGHRRRRSTDASRWPWSGSSPG